jgi:NAD dependent epimerase/dehydratase family enzyme
MLCDYLPGDKRFTHNLCYNSEKIALEASQYGIRVCFIRTGIVLRQDGGALKEMLIPFKLGLGAQLGAGKQWMFWIHMDDVIMAIEYLIYHPNLNGPLNLTAP